MREVAPSSNQATRLASVTPRPVAAGAQHLPSAVPQSSTSPHSPAPRSGSGPGFVERRNIAARRILTERIRDEFMEMPGTSLTLPQAARLFGLAPDICARILDDLIRDGKLTVTDSRYRLHSAA